MEINDIKIENPFSNKCTLWEYVKYKVRSETMLYASQKAKLKKKREFELLSTLEALEKQLNSEADQTEYFNLKKELEDIYKDKTQGMMLRSKAKFIEEGEKNSKYFLNMEKRNYNNKHMKSIINSDGSIINNPKKILEEQANFFQKLYTRVIRPDDEIKHLHREFLENNQIPKFIPEEKAELSQPITIKEISKALKEMANDKTPGLDGLTTNFYKFFWPDIKHILFDSYISSFEQGELSSGQRIGVLSLIPKKDNHLRYLKSWRPVSLLATDYKILAKTLASRLQKIIKKLINPDQVGYIKGRYISQNVRTIEDITIYAEKYNIPGLLVLIDFEKAFDMVEWPFLFDTLKQFNFDHTYIAWIKLLYTSICSCTINNGYLSERSNLSRGIRQGCPISALLFILVAEVLSVKLIFFVYLGFYVAFNTVEVISRRVVGRAEETSTYSSLGFCTVNCRPTASNYQLSHLRP